jgi:hypothetical protein
MTTRSIPRHTFHSNTNREHHRSPEVWTVEPFDDQHELWTMGQDRGFFWALVVADQDAKRCRIIDRLDGVQELRAMGRRGNEPLVLAGTATADTVDLEVSHVMLNMGEPNAPVDVTEHADLVVRVAQRLKEHQLYDGQDHFNMDEGVTHLFTSLIGVAR